MLVEQDGGVSVELPLHVDGNPGGYGTEVRAGEILDCAKESEILLVDRVDGRADAVRNKRWRSMIFQITSTA